jgi:putative polyhydroxyalkanoate system protein
MPSISVQVPHQLGQAGAQAALQNYFNANQALVTQKVTDLEQTWRGHVLDYAFKSMGMKVSGTLDVQPDSVQVVAQLPLAAVMFKGMIETQLRDGLAKVLQNPSAQA